MPYRGIGSPPMIKRAVHWLVAIATVLYVVGFVLGLGVTLPEVPF